MPGERKPGNIRARVRTVLDHKFGGILVQRGHPLARFLDTRFTHQSELGRKGNHACAEGLCQHEHVSWPGHVSRYNRARIY